MASVNTASNAAPGISIRRWSSIAIAGFCVHIAILIVLHVLCPEFDPVRQFMSEYAVGDYGWLLTIALVAVVIGCAALTIVVYRAYPPPFRSRIGVICLGIATLASLLVIVPVDMQPLDLRGETLTTNVRIHLFGGCVAVLAVLAGMLALPIRLTQYDLLTGPYRILLVLAILAPLFFLAQIFIFDILLGLVGLAQRILVAIIQTWLIVTSYGIRSGAITPG